MDVKFVPREKQDGVQLGSGHRVYNLHIGAVAALFFFSWPAFSPRSYCIGFLLSFGIGMGYHRLLTHRSYKVPKPIEYFLAVCGTLALEGGPLFWVATHRIHHQIVLTPMAIRTLLATENGGRTSSGCWLAMRQIATRGLRTLCSGPLEGPIIVWLSHYHWVPLAVLGVLLTVFGGPAFLLWGVFFRVTMGLHATWMVNSLTHIWGRRRFATRDDSRNNWFVALLSFGEGWHNNHHAHPTSARHGLAWYELDITYITIWFLRLIGLAKSVRVARLQPKNDSPIKASQ